MGHQIGEGFLGPFAAGEGIADNADAMPARMLPLGQVDDVAKQAAQRRAKDKDKKGAK